MRTKLKDFITDYTYFASNISNSKVIHNFYSGFTLLQIKSRQGIKIANKK